jgi:5-formyltetrahydrofolate cyclo-ligase
VPALGFDKDLYRLGYGKGYYDQFLARARDIPSIGVGFKEQLCQEPLPRDPWDIPVKELLLV